MTQIWPLFLKKTGLKEADFKTVAGDGQTGLDSFRAHRPVAVVLDLILPQISGRAPFLGACQSRGTWLHWGPLFPCEI